MVFWSLLETIDFLWGLCGSASGRSSNTWVISLAYVLCFYLTSLLYLENWTAFKASLCRVPSGFFTILTGDKFTPAFVVCPWRKGGYL